jgi:hypothetical protein
MGEEGREEETYSNRVSDWGMGMADPGDCRPWEWQAGTGFWGVLTTKCDFQST